MLKVAGVSARAKRFMKQNADLPLFEGKSATVQLIEENGRLVPMIRVDEDDTHTSLRAAVWLALAWRDRLLRHQGPDPERPDNWRLELCQRMHDRGHTYAWLADGENEHVASLIREGDEASLSWARASLRTFGLGDSEIEEAIRSARGRLAEGLAPFEPGQPVCPDKVRSALRTWRDRKQRLGIRRLCPGPDQDLLPLWQLHCELCEDRATCKHLAKLANQNQESA